MSDRLTITFTGRNASVEADKFYTWFAKRGFKAFQRSRGKNARPLPLHCDQGEKAEFWIDAEE